MAKLLNFFLILTLTNPWCRHRLLDNLDDRIFMQ